MGSSEQTKDLILHY